MTHKDDARALLTATEARMTAAQEFLDGNEKLLPYRVAVAALGDPDCMPDQVTAFRRELDEARATVPSANCWRRG